MKWRTVLLLLCTFGNTNRNRSPLLCVLFCAETHFKVVRIQFFVFVSPHQSTSIICSKKLQLVQRVLPDCLLHYALQEHDECFFINSSAIFGVGACWRFTLCLVVFSTKYFFSVVMYTAFHQMNEWPFEQLLLHVIPPDRNWSSVHSTYFLC